MKSPEPYFPVRVPFISTGCFHLIPPKQGSCFLLKFKNVEPDWDRPKKNLRLKFTKQLNFFSISFNNDKRMNGIYIMDYFLEFVKITPMYLGIYSYILLQ